MEEEISAGSLPAEDWTVGQVLKHYPDTASVFTQLRMACVGCVMAPFESIREVSAAYGLAPERVLYALHDACIAGRVRCQEKKE